MSRRSSAAMQVQACTRFLRYSGLAPMVPLNARPQFRYAGILLESLLRRVILTAKERSALPSKTSGSET